MQVKQIQCIYAIINVVNQRVYVGSTKDFYVRVDGHKKDLNKARHHCRYLQFAWNKYGEDKFVFGVLELVYDQTLLLAVEQFYLDTIPNLYNDNLKAEQPPVQYGPRPESFGKKISAALKGRPSPLRGRKQSPEHIAAVVEAKAGGTMSEQGKANIGAARRRWGTSLALREGLRKKRPKAVPNLVGTRVGLLTIIDQEMVCREFGYRHLILTALCDCGNIKIIEGETTATKLPKSCGCLRRVAMLNAQRIRAEQQRHKKELSQAA